MDKSWIYRSRFSKIYKEGVKSFLHIAKNHLNAENKTRCPCRDCQNSRYHNLASIQRHLFKNGMAFSYKNWIYHGEQPNIDCPSPRAQTYPTVESIEEEDDMMGLLDDAFGPTLMDTVSEQPESSQQNHANDASRFDGLFGDINEELYPGSKKYTSFLFLIKLMHVKVLNRWSNKSFDMLLELLTDAFEGAKIPRSHYDAKKKMRELGLGYESIHACKYDCALFWKEHQNADKCPVCDEPRFKYDNKKGKDIPHKILRYFPLRPRLQRLFMSRHTATDMRWHKEKRVDTEGVLRHPADSLAWKEFDKYFPWFAQDPRNVRLGLATDGFNPFRNMSNSYSSRFII